MRDFSDGIRVGINEDAYQAALVEYRDGIAVSLTRARDGYFSNLQMCERHRGLPFGQRYAHAR
jgi:hypothetical protein